MENEEKKALDLESLDVTELEDEALEDVAGGDNGTCPVINNGSCPTQPSSEQKPSFG